jgi:hypothetical protein
VYGIQLESTGKIVEYSIWTDGIHLEFGYSIWNISGMESPK